MWERVSPGRVRNRQSLLHFALLLTFFFARSHAAVGSVEVASQVAGASGVKNLRLGACFLR
jgi:hypothetical protein